MNDKTTTSGEAEKTGDPAAKSKQQRKAKRFPWKKWLTIGATAAVVAALGVWMLWPASVKVELAVARRGPLAVTVEEQGRTRAKERFTVASPISGRVMRTPLDVGDRVERGDVLARVAPPPAAA